MPNTRAVDLIANERTRQIEEKGYTEGLDLGRAFELARAGACYADKVASDLENSQIDEPHAFWPWGPEDWKPGDSQVETLEKAGALIAAALDAILNEIDPVD